MRTLATRERAIPAVAVEKLIRSRRPDAVPVTPLVADRSPQVDVIARAGARHSGRLCRQLGSPDDKAHPAEPDLVSVGTSSRRPKRWRTRHQPDTIVVTGAQPRSLVRTPAYATGRVLPESWSAGDLPIVLFVGSKSIPHPTPNSVPVRRRVAALRAHPPLSAVSILIRPHPFNSRHGVRRTSRISPMLRCIRIGRIR